MRWPYFRNFLLAGAAVVCVVQPAHAQTKTYRAGGVEVKLTVSPDFVVVRTPTADVSAQKARSLAVETLQAQKRVGGEESAAVTKAVGEKKPKQLTRGEAVLVPRLERVSTTALVGMAVDGSRVEPAFIYNGRTVILVGSIATMFKERPSDAVLGELATALKLEVIERPAYRPDGRLVRFRATEDRPDLFLRAEQLAADARVAWAEPATASELRMPPLGAPAALANTHPNAGPILATITDPLVARQWYLAAPAGVSLPPTWPLPVPDGQKPITVAVIDDGVDLNHEDLAGVLVLGYDFVGWDSLPQPSPADSHGTACAGLIAAAVNGKGIVGIAAGCRIMPIRISENSDFVKDAVIAEAITYAYQNGARVISCSWGGGPPASEIQTAIDEATQAGALVVAAAGNAEPAVDTYFPARYGKCMAVAALQRDNTKWGYSCYGPANEVDVSAPSGDVNLQGDIWTDDQTGNVGYNRGGAAGDEPSGNYTGRFGGTSAATPLVAGMAAMVLSAQPKLTVDQLRSCIEGTAIAVDAANGLYDRASHRSKLYGFGKIDPAAAVAAARRQILMNTPASPPTVPALTVAPKTGPADGGPATRPTSVVEQLDQLRKPTVVTYEVGGESVVLRPDTRRALVYARLKGGDVTAARKALIAAISKSGTDVGDLKPATGSLFIVTIAIDDLRPAGDIIDALKELKSVEVERFSTLYRYDAQPVLGTGKIKVAVKDLEDVNRAKDLAATAGFTLTGQKGALLEFEVPKYMDPIRGSGQLKELGKEFENAEPSLARVPQKF